METQRTQQELTTILAPDVEGYTRLMRANEEVTLKTLTEYRDVIDELIARHEGRVFSTGGDSVLPCLAARSRRCAAPFHARKRFRAVTWSWRTTEN